MKEKIYAFEVTGTYDDDLVLAISFNQAEEEYKKLHTETGGTAHVKVWKIKKIGVIQNADLINKKK